MWKCLNQINYAPEALLKLSLSFTYMYKEREYKAAVQVQRPTVKLLFNGVKLVCKCMYECDIYG